MGTHATITVQVQYDAAMAMLPVAQLYRHWDGYAAITGAELLEAVEATAGPETHRGYSYGDLVRRLMAQSYDVNPRPVYDMVPVTAPAEEWHYVITYKPWIKDEAAKIHVRVTRRWGAETVADGNLSELKKAVEREQQLREARAAAMQAGAQ